MGGYIDVQKTQFIHKEDRCPNNCPDHQGGTCSSYDRETQSIDTGRCSYHRNVNRNTLPVASYGPGFVIQHGHLNTLRNSIQTELNARSLHVWYSGKLTDLGGSDVEEKQIIEHSQENVINECIAKLNNFINKISDYKYRKDSAVSSHKVYTRDVIEAKNLKYLEANLQASYQDCICYSDCTMHGLSSWTERVWCEVHGGGY